MPLFRCEQCGCCENTALSNFWTRNLDHELRPVTPAAPALCSACDPKIGAWHGQFPRRQWTAADAAHSGMPPNFKE